MEILLFVFATTISTLCGGLVGIRYRKHLHAVISFTAGVLIAVAFFDLIPEIVELSQAQNLPLTSAMVAVAAGFLTLHLFEKLAVIHHTHDDAYTDHKHPLVGYVGASGLAFHSFLDGVGIGLAFHVSPQVGTLVAIAVLAHDFSDGLNTVSLMLLNKNSLRRTVQFLILDALMPILGVLSTFLFHIPNRLLILYLGFFAGFLLYLGASDLLPEAHRQRSSYGLILLTVLGMAFIFVLTRFT